MIENKRLEDELFYVNEFAFIPKTITKLEEQSLKKSEQFETLNEKNSNLKDEALTKLNKSKKNPDVLEFVNNIDFTFRKKTMYAPLTSVDVELVLFL